MQANERDHIFKEIVFINNPTNFVNIPPTMHQIWFGDDTPAMYRQYLFDKNKQSAIKQGMRYKLWTSREFTFENFPLSWNLMQTAIVVGGKTGTSRWAQVVDLARYEIIYRHGGVYMDSLFEIGDNLWDAIIGCQKTKTHKFVGANEDPCKLDCRSGSNHYLSNAFFAAPKRHIVLKRLMDLIIDGNIDMNSKYVNKTTGPYFLRKGIISKNEVNLIATDLMYPFMVNESEYREAQPNNCLVKNIDKQKGAFKIDDIRYMDRDCLSRHYPNSLAVYNSGLGGSWSW